MPYFVGLDVSKTTTSICVINERGSPVEETVAETTPKAIIAALRGKGRRYRLIGMESMGLGFWLYDGLAKAGLPIVGIHPRHAHAVLSARPNKTDRNDARGIAELMRIGTYKPVHARSEESRQMRALLVARDALVAKRRAFDQTIRALLLGLGLKLPVGRVRTFADQAQALAASKPEIGEAIEPLLRIRRAIARECGVLEERIKEIAASDPVCRRLATAPGVGPIAALAFRSTIDDPTRFATSRAVGAHLGLTPRSYQSGASVRNGHITHAGDSLTRKLLFLSARTMTCSGRRQSWLSDWGRALLARMRYKKALVAIARKLAIVLHRMWVTETDFQWERRSDLVAQNFSSEKHSAP